MSTLTSIISHGIIDIMSYSIVFTGELKSSLSHEVVMSNLARLFKKDIGFIKQLFSGEQVIIKSDLDLISANKYQMALASAGAICEVKPVSSEEMNSPGIKTAITMAAAGETIIETQQPVQASFNTSQYSMAEPGLTIIDHQPITATHIEELTADLSPLGAILNEELPVESSNIDISGITLAESGHDIFDKD